MYIFSLCICFVDTMCLRLIKYYKINNWITYPIKREEISIWNIIPLSYPFTF